MAFRTGPKNTITDVDGILVGNSEDDHRQTGVTVVTSHKPFIASVSVLGGAPGTRETDLLAPDKTVSEIDALVLSGGSAFGLEAASGVQKALASQGRGFIAAGHNVPIVPAAILFDLAAHEPSRDFVDYQKLGAEAFQSASPTFTLGTVGASAGATTSDLKGGLGSASLDLGGGVFVAALVAVNPMGSVCDTNGRFWAAPFEFQDEFGGLGVPGERSDWPPRTKRNASAATTIGIVATNAPLDKAGCQRIAQAAHAGIARAIHPSHTPFDGDLLFCLSTRSQQTSGPAIDLLELSHAASICVARSIARGIYHASEVAGDIKPTWRTVFQASR